MENHIPNFGAYGYVAPNKTLSTSPLNWLLTAIVFVIIATVGWLIFKDISEKNEKLRKEKEPLLANDFSSDKEEKFGFRKIG